MKRRTLASIALLTVTAFLLMPCLAFADFVSDPRFPTFTKNGLKFQCTFQDEDGTARVLFWNGVAWRSWGGPPDSNGEVSYVIDDIIMSHGSLYKFTTWVALECERRAEAYSAMPLPNPADRVARFDYALKMLLKVKDDHIVMPPAPLP